ncbi:ABC transporter substrate-binding protein [Haladaptatus sp. DYF46]|uniref:ABC transporter substrate-binding protein n=1 Tax=Haladaptatus sp. DYF46 TaxID=2886041 RepID=UPI001E44FA73|nr:ABC transporter substrate-binding protein [Haladaptatus sp. DYF46]
MKTTGLIGAAGMAGFAGCLGGGSGGDGDESTDEPLEVMHGWTGGDGKKAVNNLTSTFKDSHSDMETNFRPIGGGGNENLDAVVAKRLRNDNPPSAFANWPGKNLIKYEGALGNIEKDVWEEADLKSSHVKEAVDKCKYNDKMSAVPIGSHRLNCLFYNVNVVEKAGVDPKSLDSPKALVDAMDKVKQKTDAAPMALGGKNTWPTLQLWAVNMLGQSGYSKYMDYVNGKGPKSAVKSSFETTKEMITGYTNEDASTIGFTEANQKIMSGDAAFIHQGNWVAGAYKSEDLKYNEDWGFVPYPGTKGMYTLHIDAFLYPSNNPSPKKSKEWMRFVGGKDAQVAYNKWKGSIPTRKDVSTDEFGPYLTETIEDFKNAKHRPPTIAHGLAVEPETLTSLKEVISSNFSGPYNVDAATNAMIDKVQG